MKERDELEERQQERRQTFGESKTGSVEGVRHPLTKVKGEVDGRWEQRVVGPE